MRTAALLVLVVLAAAGTGSAQNQETPVDPVAAKAAALQRAIAEQKAHPVTPNATSIDIRKLKGEQMASPAQIVIAPADRNLSPEELRAKYKGQLGKSYVRYLSTCKPKVIAPGSGGVLSVTMLMGQNAALPPQGAKQIDMARTQGPLALGEPEFRPAKPAQVAPALRGKPFYDDFAVIDIPVQVAAGTASGTLPVALTLDYELFDGVTAGWIERFRDHFEAEVTVGTEVEAAATAPTVETQTPAELPAAPAGVQGDARDATAVPDAATPPMPEAPAAGNGTLWLVLGGGAAVIAAIALARRRR